LFERQNKALLDTFRAKVEELKLAAVGYARLLEIEEARLRGEGGVSAAADIVAKPPLADFLCTALAERGAKSKDQFRELAQAAGYFAEGEGGRAIHATLVNLVRSGRVHEVDGAFAVPEIRRRA
jgi:hypothetical protein